MVENLFLELLKVSIVGGVAILVISALSKVLRKSHTVFWRYCLWLLLAVRLVLPFDFSIPGRGIVISLPVFEMKGESVSAVASAGGRESGLGVDAADGGLEKNAEAEDGKTGGQSAKSRQSKTYQATAP